MIVASDDAVVRIKAATVFTPDKDGWYMSDALYMRYRRAVADKIVESIETK